LGHFFQHLGEIKIQISGHTVGSQLFVAAPNPTKLPKVWAVKPVITVTHTRKIVMSLGSYSHHQIFNVAYEKAQ